MKGTARPVPGGADRAWPDHGKGLEVPAPWNQVAGITRQSHRQSGAYAMVMIRRQPSLCCRAPHELTPQPIGRLTGSVSI